MCASVVSGNGGVDDGVDEMMRTRNHVHDVRAKEMLRYLPPRALVFSPQGPSKPSAKKSSSHMELRASAFDLLTLD